MVTANKVHLKFIPAALHFLMEYNAEITKPRQIQKGPVERRRTK
jgi:hypothetical protein